MRKCPLCQADTLKENMVKENLKVVRCGNCGLGFLKDLPSEEKLDRFYNTADYYQFWGELSKDNVEKIEQCKKLTFTKILDLIEKFKDGGRILEVGCATGILLELAEKRGWQVSGVECFDQFSKVARERIKGQIFQGMFEKAKYQDNFFDCIVFYDSLEHFINPQKVIQRVFKILRTDGLLVVATPDISSLSAKIMGEQWTHFKREHLFYFSRSSITRLLKQNSFEIVYLGTALKALSIFYMNNQFQAFPTPVLTSLFQFLLKFLPTTLLDKPFYLPCGEMTVLAKKRT